jgi:hypothetical protein
MPALTKAFETYEKPGIVVSYNVGINTSIYKGALVGVNSSGLVVPMNHATSSLKFIGIANESVITTTEAKRITITKSGTFVLPSSSTVAGKLGGDAWAKSDNEVQDSSTGLTNAYIVGTIVGIESTSTNGNGYRIRIDNHTK